MRFVKKLMRNCHKAAKSMHSQFYDVCFLDNKSEFDALFCSEYYKLERAAIATIKTLHRVADDISPAFYSELEQYIVDDKFTISFDSLKNKLLSINNKMQVNSIDFYNMSHCMKIVALMHIITIIKNGNEDVQTLNAIVKMLYSIDEIDMDKLAKPCLPLELVLSADPAGVYAMQTVATRSEYRHMVERIAKHNGTSSVFLAKQYIERAKNADKHVGFIIYNEYNTIYSKKWRAIVYYLTVLIIPVILCCCVGIITGSTYLLIITLLPFYIIAKCFTQHFIQIGLDAGLLPQLDSKCVDGSLTPTSIVVTQLLPKASECTHMKDRLEDLLLSNNDDGISVVLLADLSESNNEWNSDDKESIKCIDKIVNELNSKYDSRVIFLVRKREYSVTQRKYIGKYRKFGAIQAYAKLVGQVSNEFYHHCGEISRLRDVKYMLILDGDSKLGIDGVRGFLSYAQHPYNQPVINKNKQTVTSGYGIFAPSLYVDLKDVSASSFVKTMVGYGGISHYTSAVSEFRQRTFDSSMFTGKGLINIECYNMLISERIKSERILSHDIIEGAFLRVGFVGNIEIIEGFPKTPLSYFKRGSRWFRGDIQNIHMLFTNKYGINYIYKFALAENVFRAILPLTVLLCALTSSLAVRILGIMCLLTPFLVTILIRIFNGKGLALFISSFYGGDASITRELSHALFEVCVIPQYGIVSLMSTIKSLYRMYISKKHLLEWSTASQIENAASHTTTCILYFMPNLLVGVISLMMSHYFLFLLFIGGFFYCIMANIQHQECDIEITSERREKLISDVRLMFYYYRDTVGEPTHFLPPDNVQFSPVHRIAERTSPTNIGMMLMSMLIARDFEIITTDKLHFYLEKAISTIESLKKWHGNLYNWYSTATCEVLPNRFVSTVDSGNFLCSLVAVSEGLSDYCNECPKLQDIMNRMRKLIRATDLSVFYNRNKKLFSIGYDSEKKSLSNSHYDMLMSEARMTSYLAIGKRDVPREHWDALDRTMSKQDTYTGCVSWTGTMFEYFMPELLLHNIPGSICSESLQFCIFCQKNRVRRLELPYGISESAIYAFDDSLNYQYNPNGVQRIAIKSGQDKQLVISPYSTYLTLPSDFFEAYNNLMVFDALNCKGKYGYYECIDYTKSRVGKTGVQIVRSYMAHHIGMSIVAVANALNHNTMQKRFMRCPDMRMASELLQERMPMGEVMLLKQIRKEEAQSFMLNVEDDRYFGELHPSNPKVGVFNNGDVTSVYTDVGVSCLLRGGKSATSWSKNIERNANGCWCYIKNGNEVASLTYAPMYDSNIQYETSSTDSRFTYRARMERIRSRIDVSLCQTISCEIRKISLTNISSEMFESSMLIFMQPTLCHIDDYNAHPAFSKLFLNITFDETANTMIVSRKERNDGQQMYMAVGFIEDVAFDFETRREQLFDRGNRCSVKLSTFTDNFDATTGVTDPCIGIRFPFSLDGSEHLTVHFVTSLADSRQQAVENIEKIRMSSKLLYTNRMYNDSSLEHRLISALLPSVMFDKLDSSKTLVARAHNSLGVSALWRFGISGERPIALIEVLAQNDMERVIGYLNVFNYLRRCGIDLNLVFICEDSDTVDMVRESADRKMLLTLVGAELFTLEKSHLSVTEMTLLTAVACHIATRSLVRIESPMAKYSPIRINDVSPNPFHESGYNVCGGVFKGDSFYITKTPQLPWSHVLANPVFGTLLSDKSLGFTWAINSRQMKLTPWSNDTVSDNNGELLVARVNNTVYNLISGSAVRFSTDSAEYRSRFGDYTSRVVVRVPEKGMIKSVNVELSNDSDRDSFVDISYFALAILGVQEVNSKLITFEKHENIIVAYNPDGFSRGCYMAMSCLDGDINFVCDQSDFFTGRWDKNAFNTTNKTCVAISRTVSIPSHQTKSLKFAMSFGISRRGAVEQIILFNKIMSIKCQTKRVIIETDNQPIKYMVNTWLPHQIIKGRIQARTGFYQCGGAYGFRDQLQDVLAVAFTRPEIARTHIIRCCGVQFEQGDVLHWWHSLPDGIKGVRTRYSDDLVWLPFAVSEYLRLTGDESILSIKVRYLAADELSEGEKDRYLTAEHSIFAATVYEHCKRAIERAYQLGSHGLILMGGGDWNDGYSNVGAEGTGESVWLSQFVAITLKHFSETALRMNDKQAAENYIEKANELLSMVDKHCYDGDHYIRAFYDNGESMGANRNDECRIDSLPQSFAALSGMLDKKRVNCALTSAYDTLVDKKNCIIRLFYPPFDKSNQQPGYVKAYPRGVRENGGQYTHAAIWFALAMHKMSRYNELFYLTEILNPINRCSNFKLAEAYKLEPYYIAADIYTNESAYGRGGWSIYTGSAAWYYRLLTEVICGIRLKDGTVDFEPCLPSNVSKLSVKIVKGDQTSDFIFAKGDKM